MNLNGLAMSQKLPVKNFRWVKDISKSDESFMKSVISLHEKRKLKKSKILWLLYMIKLDMLYT